MKKLENGNYELTLGELVSYEFDTRKLNALERGGVDNWEWYGEEPWDNIEDIKKDLLTK